MILFLALLLLITLLCSSPEETIKDDYTQELAQLNNNIISEQKKLENKVN